jgi:surface antigen
VALLVGLGVTAGTAPATATVTQLCTGYTACAKAGMSSSGYAAANGTMWWQMYSGHNCTNYAAYRMVQSGLANVRPWSGSGNATYWGSSMSSITNGTPAVGAVAWWKAYVSPAGSAGHVAYVEKVISPDEIIVSQDSWGGDFSWARITRTSKGWPSGFIHFNDVPLSNTVKPSITGDLRVGSVLSASRGTWTPSDVTLTYQWRANGVAISGAEGATLTLGRQLTDKRIRVQVTASKLGYPTTSALSAATSAVQPGVLTSTAPPTVTGLAQVDETLTATSGDWSPTPDQVSYQWTADGEPIEGAVSPQLELTPSLVGQAIAVTATATRSGYEPVHATSAETAPVAPGTLAVAEPPVVVGVPRPGELLTLTLPGASPEATPAVRWLRGGEPITGATDPTYAVTAADLGSRISARIRFTRPGYTTVMARAPHTAFVRVSPTLHIGVEKRAGELVVHSAVRSPDVSPVQGVVRVRSRGRLLAEVPLSDGAATTTITGLAPGTSVFRFRFPATRQLSAVSLDRRITID